ncbi:hypothetical protein [Actinomadura decatromicini]|uniref:XRE family transcriptional regulator n=1 Tax=Actinomadura decatromicini TaxID=2604572 RepID=A0A5D3FX76_9ACTN|nr:hypothetical protein [Actinomadura decatromicini]TYK52609.1 hypothetical protein FXF68_02225 [Actinomadura decatromicini]
MTNVENERTGTGRIGTRLRAARKAAGLTVADLAEQWRDRAPEQVRRRLPALKDLERTIRGHEAGTHAPGPRYRLLWAHALRMPESELFPEPLPHENASAVGNQGISPTAESTVVAKPAPHRLETDEEDVKRRQLIRDAGALAAGAAIAPILTTLTDAWQASHPRLPGATVSRAMLDDWTDAYRTHVRSYVNAPPEQVLAKLTRDWAEMAPHLAHVQPKDVERDLAHAAAQHAYLIAGTAIQIGDPRLATRWWTTSRLMADRSGDSLLSAYTRSWEVTNRVTDPHEDLGELLILAREARRLSGRHPSGTMIYATTVEAEVLAFMGHKRAAVDALRHAEDIFERIPSTEPDREELLRFDQCCVYSLAGLRDRALEAHRAAREFYRPETHLYNTIQLDLYETVLEAHRDPGEASRQAVSILEAVPEDRRIRRVTLTARRVLDALPEQALTLPAARELRALTTR